MYYNDYNRTDDLFPAPLPQPDPVPPVKKKGSWRKWAALCLVCALLGGVGGGLAVRSIPALQEHGSTTIYESGRVPTAVNVSRVDGHTELSVSQVYANNLQSVVGINGDVKTNYWGQVVSNPVSGSGFVITKDGYILTNYHVIDGVEDLKVSFADGSVYDAVLVGGEEANDIAVLKIDATDLTPVVVGSSDDMKVGEQVVAIGNPLGELTFSLSAGYVAALDRNITMSDGSAINVMQINAAINSGNSGGPLFNLFGECIGITNAKYSNNGSSAASIEGIGFAIPINDVLDMVTDIIELGYVSGKPSVGILMNNVSSEATHRYGIPQGAYIEAILEGSCAERAGIQVGDIVTHLNDTAVETSEGLQDAIKSYKAGDTVTFTLYRDNQTLTVEVTLDEVTLERSEAMAQLQQSYQERASQGQSSQQQGQTQQGTTGTWPFSGWPFGFGW